MFSPVVAIGLGGAAVGGFAANRDVSPEDNIHDRLAQIGAGAGIGAMATIGGYMGIKALYKSGVLTHAASSAMHSGEGYYRGLSRDISRSIASSGGRPGVAAMRFIGHRPFTMAAIGAGIGAVVGSKYDDPGTGAAVGAGIGMLSSGVMKVAASRIPFKGPLAIAAAAGGIFAAGRALQPEQFESEAEAIPGDVGYSYGERGTVAGRMSMMGATGDIALGLHNRRHG